MRVIFLLKCVCRQACAGKVAECLGVSLCPFCCSFSSAILLPTFVYTRYVIPLSSYSHSITVEWHFTVE